MLLGSMLQESRRRFAERTALVFAERAWTYAQLDDDTGAIAGGLAAAGVKIGDRVAVFMPNCAELVLTYFACFKLGAIVVPLNYRYRADEVHYAVEHSGSDTLVVHPKLLGEVRSLDLRALGVARAYLVGDDSHEPGFGAFDGLLRDRGAPVSTARFDEQQPSAILYTSGTTARPKGVTYTHATLGHNCRIQAETFGFTPEDVHLVTTAACHAAAFTGQLLPNFYAGGTCVLTHLPRPEEIVHLTQVHKITRLQMLPAGLEDLVEHLERQPADVKSWRCLTAGGDVVPLDLHERFRRVAGFDITEVCGMTEVLTYVTNPPFGDKKLGSIGKPALETKIRIVDERRSDLPVGETGEIIVQTPAMTVGYWKDPKATAALLQDGWLYTGDLGRQDADGFFWFVGRKKEIIIRGGSNISPLEVEEAIDAHPAVRLSCVVGVPDKHLGERVAAYVAFREDVHERPSAEELRAFVAKEIAAYKVPEKIYFTDDLPLTASGKVDRKKLHACVLEEAQER